MPNWCQNEVNVYGDEDKLKDQTYFIFVMSQLQLIQTMFILKIFNIH